MSSCLRKIDPRYNLVQKNVKIIENEINSGEIRGIDPQRACAYFLGIVNNTLRLVLMRVLDKKADVYPSQAWNTIAKK
jgi:hypothetical protein